MKEVDLQKIRTEIENRGYDHKELHLNQKYLTVIKQVSFLIHTDLSSNLEFNSLSRS